MSYKQIIRWAGSKRKLLPQLVENAPKEYERYVEPFCGSACLFFELKPKKALLSDINEELINALKFLKKNDVAHKSLSSIPNTENIYYKIREKDPKTLNPDERAIRFLYLNRYCFNGVYRTNSQGKFNVPRGNRTGNIPDENAFIETRKILKNASLKVLDYKKCFDLLKPGDFVYLDPPYAKSGKFTGEYGVGSFNSIEMPELLEKLSELDKKGIKFLFSYRDCDELREAINGKFNINSISVKRHVSGFKSTWLNAKEILVKNYA